MSGHRKAALALHALAREDRDAVLAELPDADRRVLRTYLDELAELGFDPAAIDDALGERPAPDSRGRVDAAAAADLLRVVADEPVSFLSALLSAGPWRWEADVLAALAPQVRIRLESQRAKACAGAPARAAFVVGAVADALGAPAARAKPDRAAGLRNWIKSWTR